MKTKDFEDLNVTITGEQLGRLWDLSVDITESKTYVKGILEDPSTPQTTAEAIRKMCAQLDNCDNEFSELIREILNSQSAAPMDTPRVIKGVTAAEMLRQRKAAASINN